jgi:chromosomal replication initiation ATPase DnaA
LCEGIGGSNIRVWFEGTVPTAFKDSTLTLLVPNRFALEYIETRFGERMRRMLKAQVGPDADLLVQTPDDFSSGAYAQSSLATT